MNNETNEAIITARATAYAHKQKAGETRDESQEATDRWVVVAARCTQPSCVSGHVAPGPYYGEFPPVRIIKTREQPGRRIPITGDWWGLVCESKEEAELKRDELVATHCT